MLFQLIYHSRADFSPVSDINAELDRITRTAQDINARNGITGALLYCDGWFVQALEGFHDNVMQTYGRISQDSRHHDVHVICSGEIVERHFGQWHMASLWVDPKEAEIAEMLHHRRHFHPAELNGEGALALLRVVAMMKQKQIQIPAF